MQTSSLQKAITLYGVLGKLLSCSAGAIVGFIIEGTILSIVGAATGLVLSHLFEKMLLKSQKFK
jgi:hypothetical protein